MLRVRLTFGRDERLQYISHLDIMRLWERVFHRADIPLTYSEGFNPHPKMSVAAPLAVGMISVCELMDVYVETPMPLATFLSRVRGQLPSGMWVAAAEDVALPVASLPSALRFAEYEVGLGATLAGAEVEGRITALLSASSLPRERLRDGKTRSYDLRPLVDDLRLVRASAAPPVLRMRLQANPAAAGRPDEVMGALGLGGPHRFIKRVALVLAQIAP